jgi:hypothetical protein
MTSTYNPKFKHVPRSELKVGETYVCGDEEHKANRCWRRNGVVVPMKLVSREGLRHVVRTQLEGFFPDYGVYHSCACNDLDHLYLYEPEEIYGESVMESAANLRNMFNKIDNQEVSKRMETNNEITWETLKAGDFIVGEHSGKRMVLEVLGCLVFYSQYSQYDTVCAFETKYSLEFNNWSIVQPPKPLTKEQVLASLTPEEREALGE